MVATAPSGTFVVRVLVLVLATYSTNPGENAPLDLHPIAPLPKGKLVIFIMQVYMHMVKVNLFTKYVVLKHLDAICGETKLLVYVKKLK
tara:strand:- start:310 stop:576 length:267 start_codon:yes stop_codon:yes gene_type:complete